MGNDNGIGLSPSPWLPSGSPTLPLPSARFMPPTPALEFPSISADLSIGLPSPSNIGSIMSPSATGLMMSANPSRRNSLKIEATPTSGSSANPLESFVSEAGGYDPPSTTPTPGPEKSSQNQQSQSMPMPPPPVSSAAIAEAVTATAPRPPPVPTSSSLRTPNQALQQLQNQQNSILRKNSLLNGASLAQQNAFGKQHTSAALPATSAAIAAANWVAGGPRKGNMGLLPSPPSINPFGSTGTTPTPASLPMLQASGLDMMSSAARMYAQNAVPKDIMGNVANGMNMAKPLDGESSAVLACKERAARVGDDFARKRKFEMEEQNRRNPKKLKTDKRPEEMTKEELKKKSYAHRLYLNRQSAAVSRVRRQAYVKFLEDSLTEVEQAKLRQQTHMSSLQDENARLKAQMQQMQSGMMGKGRSGGALDAFNPTSRSRGYSRRR